MTTALTPISRQDIEELLYLDSALLDEWRLEEWMQLIHESCHYLVPALSSPDASPDSSLFLVADDYTNLKSRVSQLIGRSTWAETPRSRTRHLVTNVRLLEADEQSAYFTANFTVWRFQQGASDPYVGRYLNRVTRTQAGLRFTERRCVLDLESLRPHGKLSIIL